jgi:sugar/nucleoside kinase (ribokinase family)
MQSLVRQRTGEGDLLENRDVAGKERILPCLDIVKVDAMEAEALTGLADKKAALKQLGSWGCPEVVLTDSDGVFAYVNDRLLFQPFTNCSTAGRDGRGDTTFAAYISWRLDHEPEEALAFAAALASIKLETPGPFRGTREEVLARIGEYQED